MKTKHWMEREGDPDLTGDEMIEFLDEYCKGINVFADDCILITSWSSPVMGRSVREAINKAAVIFKEINGE